MALLDVLFRFPTALLSLVLATLIVRAGLQYMPARIGVFLLVGIAALLFSTAPYPLQLPEYVSWVLYMYSTCIIPLVWWLSLSLIEEDFHPRPIHWCGLVLYVLLGCVNFLSIYAGGKSIEGLAYFLWGYAYVLLLHLAFVAAKGYQDDLITERRKTRVVVVVFLIVAELITLSVGIWLEPIMPGVAGLLNNGITSALVVAAFISLNSFNGGILVYQPAEKPATSGNPEDPRRSKLVEDLIVSMEDEALYLEPGLTISQLASHLGEREHLLRTVINQRLGYRNFATFLNGYRLAYAKNRLRDPKEAGTLILTIAMDAGFASLSSFNRAFRSLEGLTPKEFRSRLSSSNGKE